MKKILPAFFIITFSGAFSQDSLTVKQIDSLVAQINNSGLLIPRDTIVQDHPDLGIKVITYLSAMINGPELIKFENKVNSTNVVDGDTLQTVASNTFYYTHNKLIKVEDRLFVPEAKNVADWYYSDGKSIYYTQQNEKSAARAHLLLTLSNVWVNKTVKKP